MAPIVVDLLRRARRAGLAIHVDGDQLAYAVSIFSSAVLNAAAIAALSTR